METLKHNLSYTLSSNQNHQAYDSLINNYLHTPLDLLNSIQELIIIYDINLHVVWANKAVYEFFRNREMEPGKLKCYNIWSHSSGYCDDCPVKTAFETKEISENERTGYNSKTWNTRAIPLFGEENHVIGVLEICKDISKQKRLERELSNKKEEFEQLVTNQTDVVIRINADGKFLYVSPNFENLIGKDQKELVGKDCSDLVFADDVAITKNAIEKVKLPPYITRVEGRLMTIGGYRWFSWSGKSVVDEKDNVTSIICVGRDITDQKEIEKELREKNTAYESLNSQLKLQNENYEKITRELLKRNRQVEELYHRLKESEERFRNMFLKHTSIMLLSDPVTHEIIDANLAAQHFYGYTEDEFLTKTLMDINVVGKEEMIRLFKKAKERDQHFVTLKHKLINGIIRDVEVYSVPIMYRNEEVDFSIVYDITKRKKAEKQLLESQKNLKEAIAAKDKFFSIIAHDLKNPFNSLIGLTDFLEQNIDSFPKEYTKELISTLGEVSHQGYNLLENLLQWSRAQMGNLNVKPESVDMTSIIHESVQLLQNNAQAKGIKIIIEDCNELKVKADSNMIATVVRNLVANAIKYSHKKSNVIIRCEKINDELQVSIIDKGVGIEQEDLDKLFRIDESISTLGTEKEKGTGLGLILCKEFVDRCNGKMMVKSNPKMGSTFSFTLPLVR